MLLALGTYCASEFRYASPPISSDLPMLCSRSKTVITSAGLLALMSSPHGREHQLVFVAVEVVVLQQVAHAVPGVVVEQQATEHAGLGFDGMRAECAAARSGGRRRVGIVQIRENGGHGLV
jgi:hypothetical protein